MNEFIEIQKKVERLKGKKEGLESLIGQKETTVEQLRRELKNTEDAHLIAQHVALETQDEIKFHISNVVTLALDAVFPDPYEFELSFEIKRNQTEAKIVFKRNGNIFNPGDDTGFGPVDVASFALRVAAWKLTSTRNVMILDEPFKNLSEDLQPKAGELLNLLSEKLNLQFIMVTHNEHLIEAADKIFKVKRDRKGLSYIKEM